MRRINKKISTRAYNQVLQWSIGSIVSESYFH